MKYFGLLPILLLTACASSPDRRFDEIRPGMDKAEVLEHLGGPKRAFRAKGQDHWIYVYFKGDEEYRRNVVFAGGKVTKLSGPIAKRNWATELENTTSMEEFERKARERQKESSKFKSIDGGPADSDEK